MNTELKQLLEKLRMPVSAFHDEEMSQWQITDDARVIATGIESRSEAILLAHAVNVFQELVEALESTIEIAARYCSHGKELGGIYNDEELGKARKAMQHANTITPLSSPSEENKATPRGAQEAE